MSSGLASFIVRVRLPPSSTCVNPLTHLQKKTAHPLLLVKAEEPPMPLVIFTSNESLFAFKLCLMSILTCLACSYLSFASGLKHLISPSSKIQYDGIFTKPERNLLSLSPSDISVSSQIVFCGCFLLSLHFYSVCIWPNTK